MKIIAIIPDYITLDNNNTEIKLPHDFFIEVVGLSLRNWVTISGKNCLLNVFSRYQV